jgi:hypothetical protein
MVVSSLRTVTAVCPAVRTFRILLLVVADSADILTGQWRTFSGQRPLSRKALSGRPDKAKTAGEACPYNAPSAIGVCGHSARPAGVRVREGLGHRGGAKRRRVGALMVSRGLRPYVGRRWSDPPGADIVASSTILRNLGRGKAKAARKGEDETRGKGQYKGQSLGALGAPTL